MRSVKGDLSVGKKLTVLLQPVGSRGITMKPTVLTIEIIHELRRIGHPGIPRIFDSEHILQIEPIDDEKSRQVYSTRELWRNFPSTANGDAQKRYSPWGLL